MLKHREQFYYSMGMMTDAGVDIRRAVAAQKPNASLGNRAIRDIQAQVSEGESLTEALNRHPRQFPVIERELIGAGERSGNLGETMKLLAEWIRFKREMIRRFLSGLWLPGLMIHAAAFIPGLLLCVFGKQTTAQYLLGAFGLLLWFYIPAIVFVIIFKTTPQVGPIRLIADELLLRLPLLGPALKATALSFFCNTFRLLLRAGIMIDEAIEMAAMSCGNAVICNRLYSGGAQARLGQPVSSGFKPGLPIEFTEAWLVGEETGEMDTVAERLSKVYDDISRRRIKAFCFWFPRLVYFGILIYVAMIVVQFWSNYFNNAMNML